jgi:hypothetical protein
MIEQTIQSERSLSDVKPGIYPVSPFGKQILPEWARGLIETGYNICLPDAEFGLVEDKLRCLGIDGNDTRISWGVRIDRELNLAPEGTFFHGIPLIGNGETQVVVTTSTIVEGSDTSFMSLTLGRK